MELALICDIRIVEKKQNLDNRMLITGSKLKYPPGSRLCFSNEGVVGKAWMLF